MFSLLSAEQVDYHLLSILLFLQQKVTIKCRRRRFVAACHLYLVWANLSSSIIILILIFVIIRAEIRMTILRELLQGLCTQSKVSVHKVMSHIYSYKWHNCVPSASKEALKALATLSYSARRYDSAAKCHVTPWWAKCFMKQIKRLKGLLQRCRSVRVYKIVDGAEGKSQMYVLFCYCVWYEY